MLAQSLRRSAQGLPRTERESWHAVTEHIHVYSAFLVKTTERAIHIISLVRNSDRQSNGTTIRHPPLACVIRTLNTTATLKASIRLVWTYFDPSFQNALIVCPSPESTFPVDEDILVAVAATGSSASSLRWLHLHRPPKKSKEKCCAVMQSLGVDLTLVSFKLIVDVAVEHAHVHAHGQVPALYDCIFRSLSKTEYYMHVDIDELMVPLTNNDIPSMVQKFERQRRRTLGSLVVRSRYHCAEYPHNLRYSLHGYLPLQTRIFIYYPAHQVPALYIRKYIARSRRVCVPGVHTVERYCAKTIKSFHIRRTAVIRHYKSCCLHEPSSRLDRFASLYNVTLLTPDYTFEEFSARIEEDPVVRALISLVVQMNSTRL
ncbi:hypothetical protein HPB50_010227 [Hyalomma asiaticum]|uniref:Uncharacterized protein n=1 Tax=Hyalomma asiaticum TaxID=266040 RepID=A0ACB7RNN0_HYAAI|nr:hypothetical protein HPB50_010227 [Hyalomma asiaticum]